MAWELLTLGMIPYVELASDNDVIARVRRGDHLPAPEDPTVAFIWEGAVQQCFGKKPQDRPTFTELGIKLGQLYSPPQIPTTPQISPILGQFLFSHTMSALWLL